MKSNNEFQDLKLFLKYIRFEKKNLNLCITEITN